MHRRPYIIRNLENSIEKEAAEGRSEFIEFSMGERSVTEEVSGVVELGKELQDSATSLISRTSHEEDSLRQRVLSLDSTICRLRWFIADSNNFDSKEADKLEEELFKARYTLSEGNAATFLPSRSHGRFLRMFLGPINVRATRKDMHLKVKEEYNGFRARRMDVVWGETAGVVAQLWLLCPILFILEGFEAYVGLLLLKTALAGVVSDWQVVACGVLLIIMAAENFANTVQTLVTKSWVKAKMNRGKSKRELYQG